ncbi:site-specific integrase [Enterococcus caccae]|uniref:Phage integrase n=1 Tax=Enterococcus caccae ATCC BAA-1240 TaxID=1158612 RepID=R3TR82_9ENTE|nr:site-specific integrase [Enterococcus caccae]EOL43643.1 phage integrase [Enterococcus caccae ATCC BAA-1240]EOT67957.1 phage integrase [Enterococcus caccae ATCC BAA-1240]OJG28553.1 phage integrase [Enterococcus caccae]
MVKINNIYQDKKTKKWFFRAYFGTDSNGKKLQKTKRGFSSQREAKLAYDKFMLTHGYNQSITNQLSTSNQITFEEFYRVRFVKWYEKQVKRQTFENAQFIFEQKMSYFYSLRVRDISSSDIEDWMFELSQTSTRNSRKQKVQDTLSKSYINRIRGHLKIIMDRAVHEGLIETNPVDKVSYLPLENKRVDFWEIQEFKKVMNVFSDNSIQVKHRKLVFELLFYTGLRIGELEALSWDNVNFEKNQITVEKTLIYVSKDNWYFSTPKTKNAYRTIGIGKVLSKKLYEWSQLQRMIGKFEYVIQLDGTFTPPYSFANWLKEAAIKAEIKPIKLHSLRHSHVALLIEQNIQPLAIQERMGHSNIQITLGTYGHLYAKSDNEVVEAIDDFQSDDVILEEIDEFELV